MSGEALLISGINAIGGLLESHPDQVVELWLEQGARSDRLEATLKLARQQRIAIQSIERKRLDAKVGHDRHQGLAARIRPAPALDEADLKRLVDSAGPATLLLVLDGVTDPHNFGACLRSAAAAGCTAVVTPRDRSASLNDTVLRASAGTALKVPLVQVTNLVRTLEALKKQGVWTYGAALEGSASVYQTDLRGPLALVLGAEGAGLRRLTRETCDGLVHIPMASAVESLNVSVATGILLFEALRQRG